MAPAQKGDSQSGHRQVARRSDHQGCGPDALGNLIRFVLLPGQSHDITAFEAVLAGIYCLALIGDKAFDGRWLREQLQRRNIEAVIPPAPARPATGARSREIQVAAPRRKLFLSAQSVCRIATRYEKTESFAATINIVATVLASNKYKQALGILFHWFRASFRGTVAEANVRRGAVKPVRMALTRALEDDRANKYGTVCARRPK
jgi:transposase